MIPELHGYSLILRTTHQLFHRALEGITPEQALERRDGANPVLWIAGHIVTVRSSFLRSIGGAVDVPWAKHFPREGEVKDEALWPSLVEMRAKWDEVHTAFMSRLETLTALQVAAATEAPGLDKRCSALSVSPLSTMATMLASLLRPGGCMDLNGAWAEVPLV